MDRLTKRVGDGEAVTVYEGDICEPFIKAGLCKTGTCGFPYTRWERHCNDTCVLGTLIDKLADYEDSGMTPEEVMKFSEMMKSGRVTIIPCAIGDTVYEIRTRYKSNRYGGREYDYAVRSHMNRLYFFPESCYIGEKKYTKSDVNHLGRSVFVTKAEAEAALEAARNKSGK